MRRKSGTLEKHQKIKPPKSCAELNYFRQNVTLDEEYLMNDLRTFRSLFSRAPQELA